MAKYTQIMVQGDTGWYLMNPRNPWEALRIAWMLWRHPDKVSALVGVKQAFILTECKPESSNAQVTGAPTHGA